MAKFSVDREDDGDVVPSSRNLGKRHRFPPSGYHSEQEERRRSRSRSQPVEEEEGGREEEGDRRSDNDWGDELILSEEESEEQDEDRSVSMDWFGDEYSYGRGWSPPFGRKIGSFEFTLMDPDVFDCTVCLEPLTIPIFQVQFSFNQVFIFC
ncbi:E3 ubiquitin-protein ligase SINA-like 10 [Syzygium oleosum]|uniref:E3 ubiquitin-protein ligase SINA-like 10 n=1 Tax=Syzygium oleosum TaxID=219896 RepID=UPI0011D2B146|nr:E3 ubiquitin-protein ligase SINA-like 10 [Syzygium oleosum]